MRPNTVRTRKSELVTFRQWLLGLTWNELIAASTVSFPTQPGCHSQTGNLELDLLREMVDCQVPSPTPIHPAAIRAAGMAAVASVHKMPPGGNEWQRIQSDRRRRPCWFRWARRQTTAMPRHASSSSKRPSSVSAATYTTARNTPPQPPIMTRTNPCKQHYDVLRRKFRGEDGEQYTVGCTMEQQNADDILVLNSVFLYSPDGQTTYLQFRPTTTNHRQKVRHVYRILQVASRGNFLSHTCNVKNAKALYWESTWLDPTEQWFSLPKYLASRYELALWESFRRSSSCCGSGASSTAVTNTTLPPQLWPSTLQSVLENDAIRFVVAKALADHLENQMKATNVTLLLDSWLWSLLLDTWLPPRPCDEKDRSKNRELTISSLLRGLVVSPITRPRILDTAQTAMRGALYRQFLYATEQSLLEIALEPTQRKQKREKKEKKKKKIAIQLERLVHAVEGTDEESVTNEEESIGTAVLADFPNNGTSVRQRNRHVVFILSILDSVLDDVFERVGLEPDCNPLENDMLAALEFEGGEPSETNPAAGHSQDHPASGLGRVDSFPNIPESQSAQPPTSTARVTDNADLVDHYGGFPPGVFHRPDLNFGIPVSMSDDVWRIRNFTHRDESLLADFFAAKDCPSVEPSDQRLAMSTAASIASSGHEDDSERVINPSLDGKSGVDDAILNQEQVNCYADKGDDTRPFREEKLLNLETIEATAMAVHGVARLGGERSPSLSPPSTPSPRLSPILVSLSDLCEMRKDTIDADGSLQLPSVRSLSSVSALSLPAPTVLSREAGKTMSLQILPQNDDKNLMRGSPQSSSAINHRALATRCHRSRDDHDIKSKVSIRRATDALSSYRNAAARQVVSRDDYDINHIKSTPPKSASLRNSAFKPPVRSLSTSRSSQQLEPVKCPLGPIHFDPPPWRIRNEKDICAQSEILVDDREDYQHCNDSKRLHFCEETDNNGDCKDGSTTITSALSHRMSEDASTLKEERDAFRDMCLTLGAEVAKLKNMLAAQRGTCYGPSAANPHQSHSHLFDPESMPHLFANTSRARTLVAMSDSGFRGDHESLASEDDIHRARISSGATYVDSEDSTTDRKQGKRLMLGASTIPVTRNLHEPITIQGMQSRLAKDILRFLDTINTQLQKQEPIKQAAIERMTRLVNTMWPRAQVKLYGSNVTGLSLPSSDLDFVICLPAVHKKAVAVAPGVLEGRNAINESSQKLLARTLKSESWIDPRSMKLIDRTAVPVIKVSTKDTRARALQLDITFDSPGHHGVAAIHLITQITEELPMIRPLVIVLKQFLGNRGLLTAYTGGLSSYCLFLMVARYLQEQNSSWGTDVGSLLMGFLDFYGNNFDPRSTGISVRHRLYYSRQTITSSGHGHSTQQAWRQIGRTQLANQFFRRNSFSDKGNVDAFLGATQITTPIMRYPIPLMSHLVENNPLEHNMPYNLDPLLVEDPLNESNNVGRNAFRIFSVLRAFSDAHRALVASLEWDIQSTGDFQDDGEYPLLKCLLQSEDVVFNDL